MLALGLYGRIGSPSLQGYPLASRAPAGSVTDSLSNLVAQVETRLAAHPEDGRGWDVIAPVLLRLGRNDDAARAFRNAITTNGETATRRADLGEAVTAAAGGIVSDDAKREFDRALVLDRSEPKARYFLGLASVQDGRRDEARRIWTELLATGDKDAPWRPFVENALASLNGAPDAEASASAGPNADDIAAAKDMSDSDRAAMIRGMVDRLAERLKQNGEDVQGWLRLVRAYMVLGDPGKAADAAHAARQAAQSDPARLQQLNDGLKRLGWTG
jgi:cytochrome c-type biogenesis protein CcmH